MSVAPAESIEDIKARNKELIKEVLKVYPEKTAKRRAKHLGNFEDGKPDCGVKSNIKSIPGVMTIRGCAYAGSKGVVWGPIKDMIHISHGPVGCGQYSWASRRNYYIGTTGVDTFGTMQFTSDFQEKDIVFGGDKKLAKIIDEIEVLFPLNKGISVQSECPIGLIGDDIEAVSKAKTKEYERQDDRSGSLRRLPRRFAVARPPSSPTTPSVTGSSTRPKASRLVSSRPLTTSRSSATTTSAATPGLRAFCSRKWACAWLRNGPATAPSPNSKRRPRRSSTFCTATVR